MSKKSNQAKPCYSCLNRRVIQLPAPRNFLVWGCILKRIRFGNETDYRGGKNMPNECSETMGVNDG